MPKRRNEILTAQENYLKTNDPKYIEELYRNFVRLGMFIINRRGQARDEDEILDIASDVCMRLMEKKEPILSCAPSAYIKAALFYKKKPSRDKELETAESEALEPTPESTELWNYVEHLSEELHLYNEDDVTRLVKQTVDLRVNWRKVYRCLTDNTLKQEYKERMKEIEQCVRLSASNRAVVGQ